MKPCLLRFYGGLLVLVLVLLFCWASYATASIQAQSSPEARERAIVREIHRLEVNPYRGWVQILNYLRYTDLTEQLVGVRYILYNPWGAIAYVFGPYAGQANRVVDCESSHHIWAQNGQYLGMFQMGDFARATYGHGTYALAQARAAYRYFIASGRDWSPWECKP